MSYDANGNGTGGQWTWVNPGNPSDQRVVNTTNVYDNDDHLTSTTSPTGTTSTEYDALGRGWRTTDSINGQTTTTFDARGLAIQTQTPDGRISRAVYDDKGRAIWTDDPHLTTQPTNGTQTIYDDLDRVTSTKRYADVVINLGTDAGGVQDDTGHYRDAAVDDFEHLRRRRARAHFDRRHPPCDELRIRQGGPPDRRVGRGRRRDPPHRDRL